MNGCTPEQSARVARLANEAGGYQELIDAVRQADQKRVTRDKPLAVISDDGAIDLYIYKDEGPAMLERIRWDKVWEDAIPVFVVIAVCVVGALWCGLFYLFFGNEGWLLGLFTYTVALYAIFIIGLNWDRLKYRYLKPPEN